MRVKLRAVLMVTPPNDAELFYDTMSYGAITAALLRIPGLEGIASLTLDGRANGEPAPTDPAAHIIHMESAYGIGSGKPFVSIEWGEQEAMLTPPEAVAHAMRLVQVAANAEADAAFIRFLRERLNIPKEALSEIIRDFRAMRS